MPPQLIEESPGPFNVESSASMGPFETHGNTQKFPSQRDNRKSHLPSDAIEMEPYSAVKSADAFNFANKQEVDQEEYFYGRQYHHGEAPASMPNEFQHLAARVTASVTGEVQQLLREQSFLLRGDNSELCKRLEDIAELLATQRIAAEGGDNYNSLLQKYMDLEHRHALLKVEHKDLDRKHKETSRELEDALCEQKSQSRVEFGSSFTSSSKATDGAISALWKRLDYNIRTLARFLAKSPHKGKLDDVALKRMRKVKTDFRNYLSDEDGRDFIIQGYLWHTIADQVFAGSGGIWAGQVGHRLKSIKTDISDEVLESTHPQAAQTVATWLAQGSQLLHQYWGYDETVLTLLVNKENKRLRPFWSHYSGSHARADTNTCNELRAIFDVSLELDNMLMTSKALFEVHWADHTQNPGRQQKYNEERMDSVAHKKNITDKSIVQIFVSPVLIKFGNADGHHYHCSKVLEKASVVLN